MKSGSTDTLWLATDFFAREVLLTLKTMSSGNLAVTVVIARLFGFWRSCVVMNANRMLFRQWGLPSIRLFHGIDWQGMVKSVRQPWKRKPPLTSADGCETAIRCGPSEARRNFLSLVDRRLSDQHCVLESSRAGIPTAADG